MQSAPLAKAVLSSELERRISGRAGRNSRYSLQQIKGPFIIRAEETHESRYTGTGLSDCSGSHRGSWLSDDPAAASRRAAATAGSDKAQRQPGATACLRTIHGEGDYLVDIVARSALPQFFEEISQLHAAIVEAIEEVEISAEFIALVKQKESDRVLPANLLDLYFCRAPMDGEQQTS